MAVYSSMKEYHTHAHMGMIDVTGDFQQAVTVMCQGLQTLMPSFGANCFWTTKSLF